MTPTATPTPLKTLLNPRSVAVIGASEDQSKFGGRLYKTLLQHRYAGTVYPINPGRDTLFGLKTFPHVSATPTAPDMVIMALPRDKVKAEIAACAAHGAKAGIIITSKFSDAGAEGLALENEVVAPRGSRNTVRAAPPIQCELGARASGRCRCRAAGPCRLRPAPAGP